MLKECHYLVIVNVAKQKIVEVLIIVIKKQYYNNLILIFLNNKLKNYKKIYQSMHYNVGNLH